MGAIVCVWVFLEDSARTISIVILILFFLLLSLEYVREGFSQRKVESGEAARRLAKSVYRFSHFLCSMVFDCFARISMLLLLNRLRYLALLFRY